MAESIGFRIRKLRKNRGISQIELAQKCQISAAYLSKIERGSNIPSPYCLMRLIKHLNTTADYVLFGKPCAITVEDITNRLKNLNTEQRKNANAILHTFFMYIFEMCS